MKFRKGSVWLAAVLSMGLAAFTLSPSAWAGAFDARGNYHADAESVDFVDFSVEPERVVPEDIEPNCTPKWYEVVKDASAALTGTHYVRIDNSQECSERFALRVPPIQGSYRATVWSRHGSLAARVITTYPEESGRPLLAARMAPTGRTTSDGWVEYASNDFPIDGELDPTVYIRLYGFAFTEAIDIDAVELTRSGNYYPTQSCLGVRDPICGAEGICVDEQCQLGRLGVPPLPMGDLRDAMVDSLVGRLEIFFGGNKSRAEDLPVALETMETMRQATSAWEFWNTWAIGIRQLHDWHTRASAEITQSDRVRFLNVCFIEGEADLSKEAFPSHPVFKDVLVSHVGDNNTMGLLPGDRLLAIDGVNPIQWARDLIDLSWSYQTANDNTVFSEFVEGLGGRRGEMTRLAKSFTVLRCDPNTLTCASEPETIKITDLPIETNGPRVFCDNRPVYNLESNNPDPNTHEVFGGFFRGRIKNTTVDEEIHGMIFDTLYGGGDPNGFVNSNIASAISDWKASARGVIIDHRAGNGGTIDAPENLTKLVRPQQVIAVNLMPMETAGFDGPNTPEEGLALFEQFSTIAPYTVGAPDHDPLLPVALLTHRDGSASDYLPYGMKGAPKTRIFGHAPTAGAFSTFIDFTYYGGLSFAIASGDTIGFDGSPLIGHGVVPDEMVQQKQSDLMVGVDSVHEAALAWVRSELKP